MPKTKMGILENTKFGLYGLVLVRDSRKQGFEATTVSLSPALPNFGSRKAPIMTATTPNCTLCKGSDLNLLREIHTPDRFEISVGVNNERYSRQWRLCKSCDLAVNFLPLDSTRRLSTLRDSYYEIDFSNSSLLEKYNLVMRMEAHKSDNAGRVHRINNFSSKFHENSDPIKVLDIGAGLGVFLSKLLEVPNRIYEAVALEPDAKAAEHLRSIGKFTVVQNYVSGLSETDLFQLITLNKVLEHINEPLDFLLQVKKLLNTKNGILYVEVPDYLSASLLSEDDNILGSLHAHLYSAFSLTKILRMAQLEVLEVSRISEPSGKLTVYAFATSSEVLGCLGLPMDRLM